MNLAPPGPPSHPRLGLCSVPSTNSITKLFNMSLGHEHGARDRDRCFKGQGLGECRAVSLGAPLHLTGQPPQEGSTTRGWVTAHGGIITSPSLYSIGLAITNTITRITTTKSIITETTTTTTITRIVELTGDHWIYHWVMEGGEGTATSRSLNLAPAIPELLPLIHITHPSKTPSTFKLFSINFAFPTDPDSPFF